MSHDTHPAQQDPCERHLLQPETTSDDDWLVMNNL